jgi:hypothetical protein
MEIMRKKLKLTRIAEAITGAKAREVTTNYTYWIKRSLGKPRQYPHKFLDKLLFYFFLATTYALYLAPSINKQGVIYIPSFYLRSENRAVRALVHELNHYKFPELSEQEIRTISKQELVSNGKNP